MTSEILVPDINFPYAFLMLLFLSSSLIKSRIILLFANEFQSKNVTGKTIYKCRLWDNTESQILNAWRLAWRTMVWWSVSKRLRWHNLKRGRKTWDEWAQWALWLMTDPRDLFTGTEKAFSFVSYTEMWNILQLFVYFCNCNILEPSSCLLVCRTEGDSPSFLIVLSFLLLSASTSFAWDAAG